MLHVHVLLVVPLGTGHMAQPGTDQYESGVTVPESTLHTGAAVISLFSHSLTVLVRIRVQYSLGKSQ